MNHEFLFLNYLDGKASPDEKRQLLSLLKSDEGAREEFQLTFLVIAALRSFGLGNAVEFTEKRMGIPWKQRVSDILMTSYKNKGIAIALCMAVLGPVGLAPVAMVAIATSILVEIMWVAFMDSVLFSRKRMEREIALEGGNAERTD